MIYLDTSVALAHLLAEDRRPPDALWKDDLVAYGIQTPQVWLDHQLYRLPDGTLSLHWDVVDELFPPGMVDDGARLWWRSPAGVVPLPLGAPHLVLHDVEGLSHEENGEIMGWHRGTSKSQLHKARGNLLRMWAEP